MPHLSNPYGGRVDPDRDAPTVGGRGPLASGAPNAPAASLGPRTVPGILDGALRLYLGRFGAMFPLSLVGALVVWVLLLAGQPRPLPTHLPGVLATFAGNSGLAPAHWATLVGAAAQFVVWAALLALAGKAATRPTEPAAVLPEALLAGWPRLWPLLVTALAVGVAGGVGLILLVVPGVFFITRWAVAPVAAVLEGRRAGAALGRSFSLVRGLFWHTLGASFLASVASVVVLAVLEVPGLALGALPGRTGLEVHALWQAVAAAAVAPYVPCVLVLLYYDLRARKEGLDLGDGDPGDAALGD